MKKPALAAAGCLMLGLAVGAQPSNASVVKASQHGLLLVEPTLPAPPGQPPTPDPGQNNTITISQSGTGLVVTDTTAPLTVAGAGCTLTTAAGAVPSSATCAGPFTHIEAQGGNGNDSITNATGVPAILDGGKGDDTLHAGTGADTLIGSAGSNKLYGGSGSDTIYTQGRGSNYATSKTRSSVFCVAGSNTTVYATSGDTVAPECKTVVRAQAPSATTPSGTTTPPASGSGGTPATTGGGSRTPVVSTTPAHTGSPASVPVTPTSASRTSPRLRLVSARVLRRVLRVRGTFAPRATAPIRISISALIGRRTVSVTRSARSNRSAGAFSLVMRLGPRMMRARHLTIIVHYAGDQAFTAQTQRRTIAVR
jgi:hypothetical protein